MTLRLTLPRRLVGAALAGAGAGVATLIGYKAEEPLANFIALEAIGFGLYLLRR